MQPTNSQEPTNPVVDYWHDDQIAVTHYSPLPITANKEDIIASLDLDALHSFIDAYGFSLKPFTWHDVPRPFTQQNTNSILKKDSLKSPIGKYLFSDPSGNGTLVVSFFHIVQDTSEAENAPLPQAVTSRTTHVVNLLNSQLHSAAMAGAPLPDAQPRTQLAAAKSGAQLIAAMPHFLNASANGIDHITNGCPICPPFPASDTRASGKWHIVPDMPGSYKNATGDGVFVFVLDTLPLPQQISQANDACEGSNTLLRDIAENVTLTYKVLSDSLDDPLAGTPITGNDINGERAGFPMEDHGVFIAGIIRDLAPGTRVECIRVLNDYGVGNTAMLIDALSHIQNRLLPINPETGKQGDLYKKPVIVNMSLTATPGEEGLAGYGYTDKTIAPARLALFKPMQALASQGVVFTASAGNGSGPNNTYTDPPEKRVGPRFPAAFAYDLPGIDTKESLSTMIPVGALNQSGGAASYSNYPGPLGIGTYGGELPQSDKEKPNKSTGTEVERPVDALRGVYTDSYYPALAKTDPLTTLSPAPMFYPMYKPPALSTWAYWSGTSFATPIITALVARIMQTQPFNSTSVRQTLLDEARNMVEWTKLLTNESDTWGKKIMVSQEWEAHHDRRNKD